MFGMKIKSRLMGIACAVLCFLWAPANAQDKSAEKITPYQIQGLTEGFEATDIDGKPFNRETDAKGRAILLFIWTPDFAPCKDALKKLRDFEAAYPRREELLTLTLIPGKEEKEITAARRISSEVGSEFRILKDPELILIRKFSAFQAPSFLLIDKEGKLTTPPISIFDEIIYNMKFTDFIPMALDNKRIQAKEFIHDPGRRFVDKPAPGFELTDLKGNKHSLANFKGKKNVVLVLWSPTCPHCKRELPRLQEYYEKFKDKNNFELIAVFGVKDNSYLDKAQAFVKSKSITFLACPDQTLEVFQAYNNHSVPYAFFIDQEGMVRDTLSGEHEDIETLYNKVFDNLNG